MHPPWPIRQGWCTLYPAGLPLFKTFSFGLIQVSVKHSTFSLLFIVKFTALSALDVVALASDQRSCVFGTSKFYGH